MGKVYNREWYKARAIYLKKNPLCRMCEQQGITKQADVIDHIVPHKGDKALFWDVTNWQGLCKHCHDSIKQAYERTGYYRGASLEGLPLDKKHWWN